MPSVVSIDLPFFRSPSNMCPITLFTQHHFWLCAKRLAPSFAVLYSWKRNTNAAPIMAVLSSSAGVFCTVLFSQLAACSSCIGLDIIAYTVALSDVIAGKLTLSILNVSHFPIMSVMSLIYCLLKRVFWQFSSKIPCCPCDSESCQTPLYLHPLRSNCRELF